MWLLLLVAACMMPCITAFSILPPPSISRDFGQAALQSSRHCPQHRALYSAAEEGGAEAEGGVTDPRLYEITIPRATGISWGTDLSFSWVYVRDLEPDGGAAMSGEVKRGHQLINVNGETCLGAPFDYVMDLISKAEGENIDLAFFRGTKDELQELVGATIGPQTVTITVKEAGKPDTVLTGPSGVNLRDILIQNGINVYQSLTRWTNCKGKQLCGTCIVDVCEGIDNCTIKSVDERSTLRSNPPTYRLSCVTNVYDDCTVKVMPAVGKDQWTR
ncbi:unnamed protein product [Chrysoparadoxa australica]